MRWLFWVMLPLPLLSLLTLGAGMIQKKAEPKQRRLVIACGALALLLSGLLLAAAWRWL